MTRSFPHSSQSLPTLTLVCLPVLALLIVLAACGGGPGGDETAGGDAATTEPGPAAEVEYEPAYPEEVSDEGVSAEDAAQQEAVAHGHDDGEHGHDGEDGHEHMDDHEHGADDHHEDDHLHDDGGSDDHSH